MAVSKPICVGEASKRKTAVRGSARRVICPPKLLNKMENHIRLYPGILNKGLVKMFMRLVTNPTKTEF
jgi:hypothetical protein